jgi:hypothetical protein
MGLWLRLLVTYHILHLPQLYFISISLWEMDLEELEILLRKQTHTEEEHARILGSCSSLAHQ